jgi:uncharacterized protein (TIGR02246 family)
MRTWKEAAMKRCIVALAIVMGAALAGSPAVRPPVGQASSLPNDGQAGNLSHDADREAIMKSAQTFADAFNKGDARAVAALWTENGECRDGDGQTFVGRAAIEKAYAALFKANGGARVDVLVKSVRFPARDLAVEEGVLRNSQGPRDLPTTTTYVAVHIREGGRWKIALASEGGANPDRLEALDWLLGDWTTKVKEGSVQFSFARDAKKRLITGTFTRTGAGKDPLTGAIRIVLDPETGRIRSWSFEDDGAHSQAIWNNDGKSWVLDSRGVLADGTPTAERIVLQRVRADAITWRAIDRVLGDTPLADTPPMRLTRTNGAH